ncbi:uncharacterized protein LOC100279411 [Zea mays]|uniref:uncharacterized protein LOC100279411 n=1 Tax=Zea mays TaxID=4577 RepID=UPI0002212164|nr:uncharacterized protein LOC100279411 [Zea mays]|eukprot:NP_001145895.2 uncharacterized protein LOC100279411 [Zea mays]
MPLGRPSPCCRSPMARPWSLLLARLRSASSSSSPSPSLSAPWSSPGRDLALLPVALLLQRLSHGAGHPHLCSSALPFSAPGHGAPSSAIPCASVYSLHGAQPPARISPDPKRSSIPGRRVPLRSASSPFFLAKPSQGSSLRARALLRAPICTYKASPVKSVVVLWFELTLAIAPHRVPPRRCSTGSTMTLSSPCCSCSISAALLFVMAVRPPLI